MAGRGGRRAGSQGCSLGWWSSARVGLGSGEH